MLLLLVGCVVCVSPLPFHAPLLHFYPTADIERAVIPIFDRRNSQTLRLPLIHRGNLEVYSIDEAFGWLPSHLTDFQSFGLQVREALIRNTKIPNCVGMGPTKTLAKLANRAEQEVAVLHNSVERAAVFRLKN